MLAGVCLVIGAGFAGSVVARELADAGAAGALSSTSAAYRW